MSQRYIGPLSSATLNPITDGVESYYLGGSFILFPGADPGLPEGHPYTQTLVSEGHLIIEEVYG
jgi:hypothetical protein